jgi:hypothetical protein
VAKQATPGLRRLFFIVDAVIVLAFCGSVVHSMFMHRAPSSFDYFFWVFMLGGVAYDLSRRKTVFRR